MARKSTFDLSPRRSPAPHVHPPPTAAAPPPEMASGTTRHVELILVLSDAVHDLPIGTSQIRRKGKILARASDPI